MDNFYDTAIRMQKSSEILHNNGEFHNACYLAGYVVECYAKIIVGLTYGFVENELAKEFSHDLKKLSKELQYIMNDSQYSGYIIEMRVNFSSILLGNSKWNPIKRYISSSECWGQVDSNNFQGEIQFAMTILTQMRINGVILI
ncbi:hypothetical protein [Flectobacillus roseus]|uniref:hypothetical protein n=1 Tax=Flectobacillus roseus TaxID=502259 RepID=UPI0024B7AA5F|nr:hypothetical protein [Flectobacillus roseus]MDI9869536.1 hypothetical protein [Flectobacillus roseus]